MFQRAIPFGEASEPLLPHSRILSIRSPVRARSRSDAVTACDSSRAAVPVPPSPPAPWRTWPSLHSKRLSWYHVPSCRSTLIESSRLLPAIEDSALRPDESGLLWPRLTPLCPSRSVAVALVRFIRTDTEVSQGKSCILHSVPAGFTCVRVRMTTGLPRPLPGYPTTPALYPVSVRRVRVWPPASFRFRLAADTLAFG